MTGITICGTARGMATSDNRVTLKRDRPQSENTPPNASSRKKNKPPEKCVTCKKDAAVDAIECQWCDNWEHKVCANISTKEYSILDSVSPNIMFFCSTCVGKVPTALVTYDLNIKIDSLEQKVSKLCDSNNQFGSKLQSMEVTLSTLESKIQQTKYPEQSAQTEEPKKQFSSYVIFHEWGERKRKAPS